MSLSASHKPHCATHRYGGGPCDCGTDLASSGPAGEIASNVLESLKAKDVLIRKLESERDLAIAHDTQPYPTAWAYEQTCKALHAQRERAEKAERECEAQKARAMRAEAERDKAVQVRIGYDRWLTGGVYHTTDEYQTMVVDKVNAKDAEITRLRAALESLASHDPFESDYEIHCGMRRMARQALTPAPDHAKGEANEAP